MVDRKTEHPICPKTRAVIGLESGRWLRTGLKGAIKQQAKQETMEKRWSRATSGGRMRGVIGRAVHEAVLPCTNKCLAGTV